MTRLNQIIAVEKGVRDQVDHSFRAAGAAVTSGGPLTGLTRTYRPRDENGERLPSQSTRVQITVDHVNLRLAQDLGRLWDVTATKDWANTQASASVVVDGETLIEDAPGTFLIWFEKQLAQLRSYLAALPVLDPAEEWHYDPTSNVYRAEPEVNVRSHKVPRANVLYPATPEHPAQVQAYTVDEPAGEWTVTKFSGAIPEARRVELLDRVDALARAVKHAREEANQQTVEDISIADPVFAYLFA